MDAKFVITILAALLVLIPNLALSEVVIGDNYVYTYARVYFEVSAPQPTAPEPVRMFVSLGVSFVVISLLFRFFDFELSASGVLKILGIALAISIIISILTLI